MVTGPTVMSCIERGDFGQCIGEAYFGAEPVAVAETQPAVEEPVSVEPVEAAPLTVEAEQEVAAPLITPAFAVVRVEPDGSAVIAGTAAPSTEIQIFANEALVGGETTEPSGDFVHVTETPLPVGGVELRLLDVASGEFATTSIVVIVAEDRSSEPIVVASEPGQASEILQGLEPAVPDVVTEPVAALADVIEQPTVDAQPPAAEVAAPVTDAPQQVAQVEEPVAVTVEAEPAAPEQVASPDVASEPSAPTIVEETVVALEETVEEIAVATAGVVSVPPTIDAVEIDGDRNFFAGSGTNNHAVRLYVENDAIGTTEVRDGRWLIEAVNVLTAASQRIRVDMLNADGSVASRAEVDFVVDMPEEPVSVAEAPQPVAQPEPSVAPAPQTDVATSTAPSSVPTMVGTTEGGRTTSGQVIIRRGDNLWTIARRVYGEGLRYTQIFEANTGQIRNPDLIYPGQVFELPGTDLVIGDEL